jgi:cell division protein FtsQ
MTAAARPADGGRARWRVAALAGALLLLVSSPWWGRALLRRMDYFRVRNVEIVGVRYLPASEVVSRLAVDTTASVWDDAGPLEARVRTHPQVREVTVGRRLPGTLVVRVSENLPVALVPSREGFQVVDDRGRTLPVDPSRANVDLPIVAARDTAVLRLLAEVRSRTPALFARISEVRRAQRGELLVRLVTLPVRAMADVSAERLAETVPVEEDLARRGAAVAELDLRFRDQVIARLQ